MKNSLGLLLTIFLLSACGEKPAEEYKETLYVFGTLVEVTLRGVEEDKAREAVAELGHGFQKMHKDWHAWKPGELVTINQAIAKGQTAKASPFLLPLIKQAKELHQSSQGLFDAGIGAIVGAWGFHADDLPKGSTPPLDEIRALAAKKPSMADVMIDGDQVSSSNPAVSMDFGGFGKGVALDWAVARLKARGIKTAILSAGGDVNTLGQPKDRLWKVAIRHPKHWGVIASVELKGGENLHTSGNYQRFREHEGIRYAHILDPRTGMPVDHIVSASVISENGGLADAAATALSVAGAEAWPQIAQSMGIQYVLLIDDKGTAYMNPAMQKRLVFEPREPQKKTVQSLSLN